jgi:hypothetical protein
MSIVEGGVTADPTAMKRTEEIMGTYGKWPQKIDD